ncbi:twin-arginine translocase subunit TatB [Azoarcus indigens]|uniref:Sec-independent protein translocase protein TatB n=1 Tax=Azoarcus indigens TaxID=29545 RepID=A0A4R6E9Q3_9RHOO|nr:Sec-independent protein translocase protein TatB [Azoarcus indigens]NMG63966.1 twin-arginine translocase subunit TatB [Azoarcus indigens]TDN53758.1 sec-independent protein translocase protein TatB [Azoarcus indigens]
MFDFGFSELLIIGVVALIVIGPERLPKVARTAGHLLGRLQRYVSDVKSDIQREMQLEELKSLQQQVQQQASDLENSMRSQMAKVEAEVHQTAEEVRAALPEVAQTQAKVEGGGAPVGEAPVVPAEPSPQLELGLGGDQAKEPAASSSASDTPRIADKA